MKKLILAMIVSVSSFQAQALVAMGGSAELRTFLFDSGSFLATKNIKYGHVSVDMSGRGEIQLQLQPSFFCKTGSICPMVMPAALKYSATLQKILLGDCGETIYSGGSDQLAPSGAQIELQVIDNTHNHCEYLVAVDPTVVLLKIKGVQAEVIEQDRLSGEALH